MINCMIKPDSSASDPKPNAAAPVADAPADAAPKARGRATTRPREIGGPSGLEPTRYGDWERNGRVSDF
jgi:hypothetical protein